MPQIEMQKAAFEALQVKKDLMHRQIRNQVSWQQREEQAAAQLMLPFHEMLLEEIRAL